MHVEGEALQSPHDKLFKQTFGRPRSAAAFFQSYLPASLVAAIEWDSLTVVPGSFVDEALRHQESDLLYTVGLRGQPLFLYCLFEHQSTVERLMPLRLLKYMVGIWQQQAREAPAGEGLAAVVPIVLYQGSAAWTPSHQFQDLLALPPGMEELQPLQPAFKHMLVNLSAMGLEEIQGDVIGRMALQMMRAAGRGKLGPWLESSGELFVELLQQQEPSGILEVFLRYLFAVDGGINFETVCQAIEQAETDELPRKVMSIAEELMEKGRREAMTMAEELIQKGRQEGRQEGLSLGELVGSIRTLQELLNLPVCEPSELEHQQRAALEQRLLSLKVQLQSRRD